jgi:hypothetical protein
MVLGLKKRGQSRTRGVNRNEFHYRSCQRTVKRIYQVRDILVFCSNMICLGKIHSGSEMDASAQNLPRRLCRPRTRIISSESKTTLSIIPMKPSYYRPAIPRSARDGSTDVFMFRCSFLAMGVCIKNSSFESYLDAATSMCRLSRFEADRWCRFACSSRAFLCHANITARCRRACCKSLSYRSRRNSALRCESSHCCCVVCAGLPASACPGRVIIPSGSMRAVNNNRLNNDALIFSRPHPHNNCFYSCRFLLRKKDSAGKVRGPS